MKRAKGILDRSQTSLPSKGHPMTRMSHKSGRERMWASAGDYVPFDPAVSWLVLRYFPATSCLMPPQLQPPKLDVFVSG